MGMSFKHLDVQGCIKLMEHDAAALIDIRDIASFDEGHIPSAIHIEAVPFAQLLTVLDRQKPLIICCYHGHSSQSAASFFVEQGFVNVYSLDGGYAAWFNSRLSI